MNLTNDIEVKIKKLFDKVLADNKQENYLLTVINKNSDTYYEAPKHPGQAYYSFIDTVSPESFAGYLDTFWMELGTPEFAAYAKEISEIAILLSSGYETQSEDVSSFVYTMY